MENGLDFKCSGRFWFGLISRQHFTDPYLATTILGDITSMRLNSSFFFFLFNRPCRLQKPVHCYCQFDKDLFLFIYQFVILNIILRKCHLRNWCPFKCERWTVLSQYNDNNNNNNHLVFSCEYVLYMFYRLFWSYSDEWQYNEPNIY